MSNTKVISTKISEKDFEQIEAMATLDNMSVSAILRLLLAAYKNGDIRIEKGEVNIPERETEVLGIEDTSFGIKFERICDKLRERNYPESFISKWKGSILDGARSQIEMFPKKYDPRRMRGSDCGC